jgi:transposase
METVTKVRHLVLTKRLSQREVSRRTGISRNTIAKYVKDPSPPRYRRLQPGREGHYKNYEILFGQLYEADRHLPAKDQRSIKRLYEALVREGFPGSYDTVRRYAHNQCPVQEVGYIPLEFDAGDALQFDWSHEKAVLGGVERKIYVAHFRLCYSRKPFVVAYLRESQEMVFDAFNQAFGFYGGVPRRVIIDNPKTMVTHIGKGKDRTFHPRFLSLMSHYALEPVACTPRAGWEKGQVERQVGVLRDHLFKPHPVFATYDDLNTYLRAQCEAFGGRPHPEDKTRSIDTVFDAEKESLRDIGHPFDGYIEHYVRVRPTCLVTFDTNQYSVPCRYIAHRLLIKVSAQDIKITDPQGETIAHKRCFDKHQRIFNPLHYLPILHRKPGALRDGAPFKNRNLPRPLQVIRDYYRNQPEGDKDFIELLMLYQKHGQEAVEMACELACEYGTLQLNAIISLVHDLTEEVRPSAFNEADGDRHYPILHLPPEANCTRYEHLLASTREAVA